MNILFTTFQPRARRLAQWLLWCLLSLGLAACGGGDDPIAPAIATHPASVTHLEGQTASFSVTASGSDPLSYQWRRDGADIAGATAASYSTPVTAVDNGALFSVVIANSAGTVTSNAATLTAGPAIAPSIGTQPAATSVVAGSTASFSVVLGAGSDPLSYQWQRDGTDITGANAASYTTPATVPADDGASFTVTISNAGGVVTSTPPARLSVTAAPVAPAIVGQPAPATVNETQTASFSVAATGSAPLAYQWRRNGVPIAGATAASYTTAATTIAADNGANFSVVVSNGTLPDATSTDALLTVTTDVIAPSIDSHPANVTVIAGQAARFSVTATGSAPLTYQWKRGGTDVAGANSATYTLATTAATDSGAQFTVTVANPAGSVTSNLATLTVISAAVGKASIGTGGRISMAVKSNGTVLVWGFTSLNGFPQTLSPRVLAGMNDVVQANASFGSSQQYFLRHSDGTVSGWGFGSDGELGNGQRLSDAVIFPSTVSVLGLTDAVQVSSGLSYSLALRANGSVVAWGTNNFGTLANDITTYPFSSVPLTVPGVTNAKQIAAGAEHAVALLVDGSVVEWGKVTGTSLPGPTVRPVAGLVNIVGVAAGHDFTLALRSDGAVFLWGSFAEGAGNGPGSTQPTQVSGLQDIVAIAAGSEHALALKADGTVMAWGENTSGQVGNGTPTRLITAPVVTTGLSNVVQIAAGRSFSLALLSDGSVAAWGENGNGQLGNGTNLEARIPVIVPSVNLLAP